MNTKKIIDTIVKAGVTAGLTGVGLLNTWRCPHCLGTHQECMACPISGKMEDTYMRERIDYERERDQLQEKYKEPQGPICHCDTCRRFYESPHCPECGTLAWVCGHCKRCHMDEVCPVTGKTPYESGYNRKVEEYERELVSLEKKDDQKRNEWSCRRCYKYHVEEVCLVTGKTQKEIMRDEREIMRQLIQRIK